MAPPPRVWQALLLACACTADAWWQDAPEAPPLSTGTCVARFARDVTAKQEVYEQRCISFNDILHNLYRPWVDFPKPVDGGCFSRCWRYSVDRRFRSRAVVYVEISADNDNAIRDGTVCWCGGDAPILNGPHPSSYDEACPLPVHEVPMTCMWLDEEACSDNTTTDGACVFVDGCCLDARTEYTVVDAGSEEGAGSQRFEVPPPDITLKMPVIIILCLGGVIALPMCAIIQYQKRHQEAVRAAQTSASTGAAADTTLRAPQVCPAELAWLLREDAVMAVLLALRSLNVSKACPLSAAPSAAASVASAGGTPRHAPHPEPADGDESDDVALLRTASLPHPLRRSHSLPHVKHPCRPPSRSSSKAAGLTVDPEQLDASEPPVPLPQTPGSVRSARCCAVCLEHNEPDDDDNDRRVVQALGAAARALLGGRGELIARGWGTLPCGHSMHVACVRNWFVEQVKKEQRPSCPLCRGPAEVDPFPPRGVRVEAGGRGVAVVVAVGDTTAAVAQRVAEALREVGVEGREVEALGAAARQPALPDRPYHLVRHGEALSLRLLAARLAAPSAEQEALANSLRAPLGATSQGAHPLLYWA